MTLISTFQVCTLQYGCAQSKRGYLACPVHIHRPGALDPPSPEAETSTQKLPALMSPAHGTSTSQYSGIFRSSTLDFIDQPRFCNCSMAMDPIQLIGGSKGEIIGSAQKFGFDCVMAGPGLPECFESNTILWTFRLI